METLGKNKSPIIFQRIVTQPELPDGLTYGIDFYEDIPEDEAAPLSEESTPQSEDKETPAPILNDSITAQATECEVESYPSDANSTINNLNFALQPFLNQLQAFTPRTSPSLAPILRPTAYIVSQKMVAAHSLRVVDNELYVFDVTHYRMLPSDEAQRLIFETCEEDVKAVGTPKFVRDVYETLLINPHISYKVPDATISNLMCFKNGVLNLLDGKLYAHSPDFFTTCCLNANYREGYYCPSFSAFLCQVTGNDYVLAQRIWEFIGYCLVPDIGAKTIFALQGLSNTGKTTLTSIFELLFPSDAICSLDVHLLNERFTVSELNGARICISPDLPAGPLNPFATSVLKQLSGGDLVSSDIKFKSRLKFHCTAKFILASNHKIFTKHGDVALMERFCTIPFRYPIPKESRNTQLVKDFALELDAIAFNAIQAYYRLRDNNYKFSGDFQLNEVVSDYDESTEISLEAFITKFLQTCFEQSPDSGVFTSDAHAIFERQFFEIPLNAFSSLFSKEAARLYGAIKKRSRKPGETNPTSYISGIDYKLLEV